MINKYVENYLKIASLWKKNIIFCKKLIFLYPVTVYIPFWGVFFCWKKYVYPVKGYIPRDGVCEKHLKYPLKGYFYIFSKNIPLEGVFFHEMDKKGSKIREHVKDIKCSWPKNRVSHQKLRRFDLWKSDFRPKNSLK